MNSFAYHINKYSTELKLAITNGWQYNMEGKILPACTGKTLSKAVVLSTIYKTLQNAPIYSLDVTNCNTFIATIRDYTNSIPKNEIKRAQITSLKIQQLVNEKRNNILQCSTGFYAKKANTVLDKEAEKITPEEYSLLYDLTTMFAIDRFTTHIFYRRISLLLKMEELRKNFPNIKIKIESESAPLLFFFTSIRQMRLIAS